ncbi:MAG TPA: NUDIX domain-containing protein [Pseudonocardiaceae bacterium]|jgi:8-oxo-dGTP diphosphatase|nr:NUDIX domain-containing protein [Pseudonocardiaceae bacterium]
MVEIRVAAPARTVAAALAEPWLLRESLAASGVRLGRVAVDQFARGDEFTATVVRVPLRLRVTRADERGLTVRLGRWTFEATVTPDGDGAVLRCDVRGAQPLLTAVRARAEQLTTAPIVVGAAIVDQGTVLAAQRDRPPVAAGRWEFPGGKVERGEDERAALARECREELAADVVVGDRLGPDLVLPNGWLLRVYLARLSPGAEPVAGEHRALRWVPADRLPGLDWLPPDRIVLPGLAAALALSPAR